MVVNFDNYLKTPTIHKIADVIIPGWSQPNANTVHLVAARPCIPEAEGFEPSWDCSQTDFESAPL